MCNYGGGGGGGGYLPMERPRLAIEASLVAQSQPFQHVAIESAACPTQCADTYPVVLMGMI